MLIGLAGRKRSGKDSSAALLVKELGFKRLAFADKLKEMAAAFVGLERKDIDDLFKDCPAFQAFPPLFKGSRAAVPGGGIRWDGRDVLQRLGTAGREVFGKDFWIEQALRDVSGDCVVTDVRYRNEVEAIKTRGGLVIRLNRADGWNDGDTHPSETELPDAGTIYDAVIETDSAEQTAAAVLVWVKERQSR